MRGRRCCSGFLSGAANERQILKVLAVSPVGEILKSSRGQY